VKLCVMKKAIHTKISLIINDPNIIKKVDIKFSVHDASLE